jgi:hypothetical protein
MKARAIILTIGIVLLTYSVSAQDAMPTKEETVNYLNKKLKEIEGRSPEEDRRRFFSNTYFKVVGEKVEIRIQKEVLQPAIRIYIFDPAHIKAALVVKDPHHEGNPDVGWIQIVFPSDLAEHKFPNEKGHDTFRNNVLIPFLRSVPGNGEKIVKAINHLRDLAKAEDELF